MGVVLILLFTGWVEIFTPAVNTDINLTPSLQNRSEFYYFTQTDVPILIVIISACCYPLCRHQNTLIISPADEQDTLKMSILGMIPNCMWWWDSCSGECGIFLHCHYSQIQSGQEVIVSVRVPFMGQVELLKKWLYSKGPSSSKKKSF